MKNNTKTEQDCAGRAATGVGRSEPFLDRTQILRSIQDAYRAGRPVEAVMRARMTVVRARVDPEREQVELSSMEYGRSVYKKRRCGKVASFFRCLLR